MLHQKWRETKQQPSMLPGTAVHGCFLVSLHFLCYILCSRSVFLCRYEDGVIMEVVLEKFVKYFRAVLHHNQGYDSAS